jgi:hypothetical protein
MSANPNALAELQKTAQVTSEDARTGFLKEIAHWNLVENNPYAIAMLLSKLPLAGGSYLTPPQCMVLALEAHKYDADPFAGEIFITPNGKIGFTVEFKMKYAARQYKIGVPQYKYMERPWPTGKPVNFTDFNDGKKLKPLPLDKDQGCICSMKVEGFTEAVTGEAWLSEWFMPSNPNWVSRWRGLMLPTRARGLAVEALTGLGSSGEHTEIELGQDAQPVTPKVVAPKEEVATVR